MTTIIEISQLLWLETPRGPAIAKFMIDRGVDSDLEWVCVHQNGEIWSHMNYDVRAARNVTVGRTDVRKPRRWKHAV